MHIEPMESRLFLTTVAPGGEEVWGDGNWGSNGTIVNGSSHPIYVYVTGKGWVELPPGMHTPDHCDADAWTFDPTKNEGPRDVEGNPRAFKVPDGDTTKATDTDDGDGVNHDPGGSTPGATTKHYPEEINGKHPKDLPPGHDGTPDDELEDEHDRDDDFDWWYDDPNENTDGKDNPNSPGYQPPRPPANANVDGLGGSGFGDDDDDDLP